MPAAKSAATNYRQSVTSRPFLHRCPGQRWWCSVGLIRDAVATTQTKRGSSRSPRRRQSVVTDVTSGPIVDHSTHSNQISSKFLSGAVAAHFK